MGERGRRPLLLLTRAKMEFNPEARVCCTVRQCSLTFCLLPPPRPSLLSRQLWEEWRGRDNGTIHLAAARKSKRKVPKTTRFFQETKKNTFGLKFSERIQNLREFMYRYWRISHFCARMAKSSKCLSLSSSLDPPSSFYLPSAPGRKRGKNGKKGERISLGSGGDTIHYLFLLLFPLFSLERKRGLRPSRLYRKKDERRDNSLSFFLLPLQTRLEKSTFDSIFGSSSVM